MTDIAILINKFKNLGYEITVQGDSIKYKYIGNGHPSRDGYTLLEQIKTNKEAVINYLKSESAKPKPYVTSWGTLVIPFDSDRRFHWWNRGLSIKDTLRELGASDEILKRYKSPYSDN